MGVVQIAVYWRGGVSVAMLGKSVRFVGGQKRYTMSYAVIASDQAQGSKTLSSQLGSNLHHVDIW